MMFSAVPINEETWLVCGGRNFSDQAMFDDAMSTLIGMYGCPKRLIHGAATGADTMADKWAQRLSIEVTAFPADWEKHGRSAGPIRNRMMALERPTKVIAFDGGRGTQNMIDTARKEGIDVIEIKGGKK